MMQKLSSTVAIAIITCLWVIFDYINLITLHSLQSNPHLYTVYWLAGFRLLAIILFGYIGYIGIFLGYVISGILLRHFPVIDALSLGFLSSTATLIAYKLWQRSAEKSDEFHAVSFMQLFYLVALNGLITSFFRFSYLEVANKNYPISMLIGTFAANVTGALIFLYLLKIFTLIYQRLKIAS